MVPREDLEVPKAASPAGPAAPASAQGAAPVKVLFISFHFPPMNVISAFRAEGFADFLPGRELALTVVTLQWEYDQHLNAVWHAPGTPVRSDRHGAATVIRIPRIRTRLQRSADRLQHVPVLTSAFTLCCHLAGFFNISLLYAHGAFKRNIRALLQRESFDVVLASAPPDEDIRLGAWASERAGIPLVADYRDHFDLRNLAPGTNPSWKERLLLALKHRYHQRWARRCSLVVSVSKPLVDAVGDAIGVTRRLEVRNGYLPAKITAEEQAIRADRFRITYAGRIYPWQDTGPFTQAYRRFTQLLTNDEAALVDLRFYGCKDQGRIARLQQDLQGLPFEVQAKRIPETTMYRHLAESSVLLVFDIGIHGGYTGKLMDYLGCRRNVLLIPSDQGVMADLVHTARIGLATRDTEQAAQQLLAWYREWQTRGRPDFRGDEAVIAQGSRQAQTAKLAEAVQQVAAKKKPA